METGHFKHKSSIRPFPDPYPCLLLTLMVITSLTWSWRWTAPRAVDNLLLPRMASPCCWGTAMGLFSNNWFRREAHPLSRLISMGTASWTYLQAEAFFSATATELSCSMPTILPERLAPQQT